MDDHAPPLGYVLVDPRPIAASAPYTFFLPSSEQIVAVGPGDLVKLIFEYDQPGGEYEAERMWVRLESSDTENLWGHLGNEPYEEKAPLKLNDPVTLFRHHIIDIEWANPDAAPRAPARRQYWERCLVDACVLDGGEPVEYLYREEPDMAQDGDQYPDSGWRIRGRGCFSDEASVGKIECIAIGKVLNADDSWLNLVDAPIGSAFNRDLETGEYIALD